MCGAAAATAAMRHRHDAIQIQASPPPSGEGDLALPFPREIVAAVVAGIRLVTVGAADGAGFGLWRRNRRRRRLNCLILFQGKSASEAREGETWPRRRSLPYPSAIADQPTQPHTSGLL